MDSGNSGSIQSSSGGDEEFDSRGGESIPSFLNPLPHFGSISTPNQLPFLTHHQNPTFFNNPQNPQILDHNSFQQSNPNSQYNDLIWSRGLRSHEPNYGNLGNLTTSSSSVPTRNSTHSINASAQTPFPNTSSAVPTEQPKNPKKRTRASRRAPTTVLTTDTTNFRQMVQEFTGIPAAPFTNSPYSRRLDLFSAASALRSSADALGPLYPLRPSPHKVISPFSSSSSPSPSLMNPNMMNSIPATANISSTNNTTLTSATTLGLGASSSNNQNNYPLVPSDHLLMNNLQQRSMAPLQLSLNKNHLGENASMNYGNMSGFPSHETHDENFSRWRSGETVLMGNNSNNENLAGFDHGNMNSSNTRAAAGADSVSGYNLNLSEKAVLENAVVSSGNDQGNVSSWICPSD